MFIILISYLSKYFFFLFYFKPDERESIENMRTDYYHQLRKHLEPESLSQQSKTKSISANFQHNSNIQLNNATKTKQDVFRNQIPQDSFGSLDTTALI
jgi:hypothetical protein